MSGALPLPVARCLEEVDAVDSIVAYLRVDAVGSIEDTGGALDFFRLDKVQRGVSAAAQVDCLFGLDPTGCDRMTLSWLEFAPGRFASIHVFPAPGEGGWIVFTDATVEAHRRQGVRQRVNELALLERRFARLEQRVAGELAARGDDLRWLAIPAALGLAALERTAAGSFRSLGELPSWWTALPLADALPRLGEGSPFLGPFLEEAEVFWESGASGTLRSGPWEESDGAGHSLALEGLAVTFEGRAILLLAPQGELQGVLQAARVKSLDSRKRLARQERALEVLRDANEELEARERETTEGLQDSAERLQEYQTELRELALQLVRAEDEERRRIATGLHDGVGQILAVSKIKLGLLRARTKDARLLGELGELQDLLTEVVQHTRSLTFDLVSPVLDELGLRAALESLGEQFSKRHGLAVALQADDGIPEFSVTVSVLLFQSVRELLFNALKHANATRVDVRLEQRHGEVTIVVDDDGRGLPAEGDSSEGSGFGLDSIRRRLEGLGGQLLTGASPQGGASFRLTVPRQG